MGASQSEKQISHDRIVGVAAACFCRHGVDGIGLSDLMKQARLTHGGFYIKARVLDDTSDPSAAT